MTQIILKGDLDFELTRIGLQPGMPIMAEPDKMSTVGAMNFEVHFRGWKYDCVVWPENYDFVESNNVVNYAI